MVSVSHFIRFVGTIALLIGPAQQAPTKDLSSARRSVEVVNRDSDPVPFYAIAHRVLEIESVDAALKHGANALEIDLTAWKEGWWADHDGTEESYGKNARDLFKYIAKKRKDGEIITMVWLDIKNPDEFPEGVASIHGLMKLAREHLTPIGISVLWGFMPETSNGNAFKLIRDSLEFNEAINLNGNPKDTVKSLEGVNSWTRVASYGDTELPHEFGDCHEDKYFTCTELRQAKNSEEWGQVFGWTLADKQTEYVGKLLGQANIDGLIYGFKRKYYTDDPETHAAARDISSWVENHPQRHMAKNENPPW